LHSDPILQISKFECACRKSCSLQEAASPAILWPGTSRGHCVTKW